MDVQHGGHDPRQVLADAYLQRSIFDAESVDKVLHYRVTEQYWPAAARGPRPAARGTGRAGCAPSTPLSVSWPRK